MLEMSLLEAATILGLENKQFENVIFSGISIDSRKLSPNNLFVALAGTQVDGHHFLEEVKAKGAKAALVSHPVESTLPQLVVPDVVLALGQLAANWRERFNIPFFAITGSNGKTTLKNMVAAILTAASHDDSNQVLATLGNYNNHLGLPLTLSQLNSQHHYAVIEMGMNHFGEIKYLSQLTKPDVAIITNAGHAHLEGVGDIQGVARAKGEIFLGLSKDGIAILNRDDNFFDYWREQISHHYLSFGFHENADITGKIINTAMNKTNILLNTPEGEISIQLPLLGKHNLLNAMCATAATLAIGIDPTYIKAGLEHMKPEHARLEVHPLNNGVNIIDDTYNANPLSLFAAIETLTSFTGKKIIVLGDMKELGKEAKILHEEAGEKIREAGIDYLFTYGEISENTSLAFGEGAFHFTEQKKLINALKPLLLNATTILIKGSRSMRMDKVVQEIVLSE